MKKNNIVIISRIILGMIFVVSGTEKLLNPYQNFLYVIQNYQVIGPPWDEGTAKFFPWLEFFLGLFCCLGLWSRRALQGILVLLTIFIAVVGQALLRRLPIMECGCFGGLLSIPLEAVLVMDSGLWLWTSWLLARGAPASDFGLDGYFAKK